MISKILAQFAQLAQQAHLTLDERMGFCYLQAGHKSKADTTRAVAFNQSVLGPVPGPVLGIGLD